jgi:hypothetical protein
MARILTALVEQVWGKFKTVEKFRFFVAFWWGFGFELSEMTSRFSLIKKY